MGQDDTTKTTTGAPDAETAELLLRQVKNKVDQEGKNASSDSTIAISKMLKEATCFELFKIIMGWFVLPPQERSCQCSSSTWDPSSTSPARAKAPRNSKRKSVSCARSWVS